MINEALRHIIEAELRSGEKLLWCDSPARMPKPLMPIFYTLFVIIWLVGLIFMLRFGGFLAAAKTSFAFIAIPLFMLGAGLLILWFSVKAVFAPSKQIYGLTNSRAIIAENYGKGPIRSFGANELSNYSRKGSTDIGTLEFVGPSLTSANFNMSSLSGSGFYEIQDPKYVENLIYKNILKDRN